MSLKDNFTLFYDKATTHKVSSSNSCSVLEHNHQATMTRLDIICQDGIFDGYDQSLIKNVKDTTERLSSNLDDKDCDGVVFLQEVTGREHLIFVELKSKFDVYKITGAFHQMIMSFVKMHSWLSSCAEYDLLGLPLHFVVACKCFKDKDQEAGVLLRLSQVDQLVENSFERKFLKKLLDNKKVVIKMSELESIKKLPFHANICSKEVALHLQLTSNYSDNSTCIAIP